MEQHGIAMLVFLRADWSYTIGRPGENPRTEIAVRNTHAWELTTSACLTETSFELFTDCWIILRNLIIFEDTMDFGTVTKFYEKRIKSFCATEAAKQGNCLAQGGSCEDVRIVVEPPHI